MSAVVLGNELEDLVTHIFLACKTACTTVAGSGKERQRTGDHWHSILEAAFSIQFHSIPCPCSRCRRRSQCRGAWEKHKGILEAAFSHKHHTVHHPLSRFILEAAVCHKQSPDFLGWAEQGASTLS